MRSVAWMRERTSFTRLLWQAEANRPSPMLARCPHSRRMGAAMLVAASQATTRAARDNRAVMPRVNWAARDSKLSALSMELYTMR